MGQRGQVIQPIDDMQDPGGGHLKCIQTNSVKKYNPLMICKVLWSPMWSSPKQARWTKIWMKSNPVNWNAPIAKSQLLFKSLKSWPTKIKSIGHVKRCGFAIDAPLSSSVSVWTCHWKFLLNSLWFAAAAGIEVNLSGDNQLCSSATSSSWSSSSSSS